MSPLQYACAWEGMLQQPAACYKPPRALVFFTAMKLFYLDESGNPTPSSASDSYVLVAVGIPIEKWTYCDKTINQLKASYDLSAAEIHTAWMLRSYREQQEIEDFATLSHDERRQRVMRIREQKIEHCKATKDSAAVKSLKKNYKNTEAYIHLTYEERKQFIYALAAKIKSWTFARIFAEAIEKDGYRPPKPDMTPEGQAFERVVTRIEKYLSHISADGEEYGLLIHDECESVKISHVANMKHYQRSGTFKVPIRHIIETPLFVNSNHTNMVQIADLCAYALRRYFDAGETELFSIVKARADKIGTNIVGLNHYTSSRPCQCDICKAKARKKA